MDEPIVLQSYQPPRFHPRRKALLSLITAGGFLLALVIAGSLLGEVATATHSDAKNLAPSLQHPFGTDWLGRDLLSRTLKGLSVSILIGLLASGMGAALAGVLGLLAAYGGKRTDATIAFLINVVMGIPHLLLLLLISYALGKGLFGVVIAMAVSHWPTLARMIRAEALAQMEMPYVKIAKRLGQSKGQIAKKHLLPHIFPQFLVGLILLFPHAILHEASLTFLGFGLQPEQTGIGMILSESMKYLSLGMWWLAVFPGLSLLMAVLLFDAMGKNLKTLLEGREPK